jgi:hypothetical protein
MFPYGKVHRQDKPWFFSVPTPTAIRPARVGSVHAHYYVPHHHVPHALIGANKCRVVSYQLTQQALVCFHVTFAIFTLLACRHL